MGHLLLMVAATPGLLLPALYLWVLWLMALHVRLPTWQQAVMIPMQLMWRS